MLLARVTPTAVERSAPSHERGATTAYYLGPFSTLPSKLAILNDAPTTVEVLGSVTTYTLSNLTPVKPLPSPTQLLAAEQHNTDADTDHPEA